MKKQSLSTIEFNFVFVCGLSVCNSGTVSFHWGGGEHFVPGLAQSSGVVRGVGLRFWNGGEGVSLVPRFIYLLISHSILTGF